MDISLSFEIFLILAAGVAGFVDAIAGGGGLIVVPLLMLTGISPAQVLGTSKLQAIFGSGSATYHYAKRGYVDLRTQWLPALLCLIASFIGADCVTLLPRAFLEMAMPVVLIAVALYFGLRKSLGDEDRQAKMDPFVYACTITPLVAFYDGIFGPGAGTFYMLGFVALAGYGMTKATAHTKLLNFMSNLGALVFFAMNGSILWQIGLMMGFAQIIGAQLGARTAIRGGAKIIRPLIVITSIVLAIRLLF